MIMMNHSHMYILLFSFSDGRAFAVYFGCLFYEVRNVRTGEFTLLPRELGLPASGRQWFETTECSYAVFTYIHAHCLKLQEDSKRRDFMPRWMTSVGAISER